MKHWIEHKVKKWLFRRSGVDREFTAEQCEALKDLALRINKVTYHRYVHLVVYDQCHVRCSVVEASSDFVLRYIAEGIEERGEEYRYCTSYQSVALAQELASIVTEGTDVSYRIKALSQKVSDVEKDLEAMFYFDRYSIKLGHAAYALFLDHSTKKVGLPPEKTVYMTKGTYSCLLGKACDGHVKIVPEEILKEIVSKAMSL